MTPASPLLSFDVILTSLLIRWTWVSYRRGLAGKGMCYTLIKTTKEAISCSQESYHGPGLEVHVLGSEETTKATPCSGTSSLLHQAVQGMVEVSLLPAAGEKPARRWGPSAVPQGGTSDLLLPLQAAAEMQMQSSHWLPDEAAGRPLWWSKFKLH